MAKKKGRTRKELRNLRIQQFLFIALGVLIIFSMVISMIAK